jgi:hypothetical protein
MNSIKDTDKPISAVINIMNNVDKINNEIIPNQIKKDEIISDIKTINQNISEKDIIETKNDNAEISHGGGADNCLADNSSFAHVDDGEDAMSSLIMSVANNDEDDIDTANIMTSMLSNKRLQSELGSTSTKVEIARDSRSNKNNIDLKGSENKDTDGDVTDAKSRGSARKKPKRGKLLNGKIFSKSKLQLNLPQKPPNKMAGICH